MCTWWDLSLLDRVLMNVEGFYSIFFSRYLNISTVVFRIPPNCELFLITKILNNNSEDNNMWLNLSKIRTSLIMFNTESRTRSLNCN